MDPFTSYWTNGAYGYLPDPGNPPPNDAGDANMFWPYMATDRPSVRLQPVDSRLRRWRPSLVSADRDDTRSCTQPHWFYFCPAIYQAFVLDDSIQPQASPAPRCEHQRQYDSTVRDDYEHQQFTDLYNPLPGVFIPQSSAFIPLPNGGCPLYRYTTDADGLTRRDLVSAEQLLHCKLNPRYNPAQDLAPESFPLSM